jgi:uncharacterized protein
MLINLKVCAAKARQQNTTVELKERLPAHIVLPCQVACQFVVKSFYRYYLITLKADSILTLICQRCLKEFTYHYRNQTELAVCDSDKMAEQLMDQYECIVSPNELVDLNELLTDELHLYGPEFHPQVSDCNNEVSRFINTGKS